MRRQCSGAMRPRERHFAASIRDPLNRRTSQSFTPSDLWARRPLADGSGYPVAIMVLNASDRLLICRYHDAIFVLCVPVPRGTSRHPRSSPQSLASGTSPKVAPAPCEPVPSARARFSPSSSAAGSSRSRADRPGRSCSWISSCASISPDATSFCCPRETWSLAGWLVDEHGDVAAMRAQLRGAISSVSAPVGGQCVEQRAVGIPAALVSE